MNIYLLKRTDKWSYDDYDAAVVIAENEELAKNIKIGYCPSGMEYEPCSAGWTTSDRINVTLIGTALSNSIAGVILDSFNAG